MSKSSIPKSVTYSELVNSVTSNTAVSTTETKTISISRTFSTPTSTKLNNLSSTSHNLEKIDNKFQLSTCGAKSKASDADSISVDDLTK